MYPKQLCGIDEAGRGPLAGSLVVAGVVLTNHIDGLRDSKKLSQKRREILYPQIISNSIHHIVIFNAQSVDEIGLSKCIATALLEIQLVMQGYRYLFDGNSSFGVDGIDTMVKADTKIDEVSAASILAKVTHDREMDEIDKLYPEYGFAKHKGYGTKAHIEAIKKYGKIEYHRKSFKIKGIE